ncbi:glycosyltransferase [Actinoplanes sp. GCM10030250]|uniref:glycosyltransferase n=1 Tax=Actinoplanes sp. GCM10030250 TaxID=3273376 RepID=UPI0036207E7D
MSVVIPAETTGALPLLLGTLPPVHEVIVVVGPAEDTGAALPRAARVIRQTRTGSGNAVACGAAAATGDVVVTLASDGSCDPADVTRFVAALREGADVVHGSRYLTGRARWADVILLWLISVLFGCRPTDPGFGYRAFWRDTTGRLGLPRVTGTEPMRGDGSEGEVLLTVRTTLAGLHVAELPAACPRAGRAGAPLVPAVRALFAERAERRRTGDEARDEESIVILTGATPEPSHSMINAPAGPDRYPGTSTRIWPAPNPRSDRAAYPLDTQDPGAIDRRNSERRTGERRLGTSRFAGAVQPAGHRIDGDALLRRRWRDNLAETDGNRREIGTGRRRVQGRPDLRVINGEGSGTNGTRGHLRSVPRPRQP